MLDRSRRRFFFDIVDNSKTLISKAYRILNPEAADDYFKSYESAYTLISENLPFLEDEIERLSIDTTGKTQLEIVREIYEKTQEQAGVASR